jgi:hypothetical protein
MVNVEKLRFYAEAKRATAIKIHKFEDGNFVPYWIGRLNGKSVTLNSECRHTTRKQAVEDARRFRESCRNELEGLGT